MNDTSAEIASKVLEMMRKKTPQERLKMGCAMHDASRRLVLSSILQKTPNASHAAIRREIFLRFYGNDFDALQREKIIAYLQKA